MSKKEAWKDWCDNYQGSGMEACKTCGWSFPAHYTKNPEFSPEQNKTYEEAMRQDWKEKFKDFHFNRTLSYYEKKIAVLLEISKQYEARIKSLEAENAQYDKFYDEDQDKIKSLEPLLDEAMNWVEWAIDCMTDNRENTSLLRDGKNLLQKLNSVKGEK